jgi:hypothetical protein
MTATARKPAELTRTPARRFVLPVSGRLVDLRHLTGVEDMLLAETANGDTGLALELAARLVRAVDGQPLDWDLLAVTDLDAFVLSLRRALLGDRIVAEAACQVETCRAAIDMSFAISDYVAHCRPRREMPRLRSWSVTAAGDPGWYSLCRRGDEARPAAAFRLPSGADLLASEGMPHADDALARRCIRPADTPPQIRRRVEVAMEILAPSLAGELGGVCPSCGTAVTVHFDPRRFCLRELRDRSKFIYGDIDVLARRYHWSERAILTLPAVRRASYAEFARQAGAA